MGGLSWAGSINRYWFMILALNPLNRSFAAVRRDRRSAPAHWGDAKTEFLTECIQQHGVKKDICFQHRDRDGDTAAGTHLPTVFCSLPYFRSFLLSQCRAFKDCVPYLGLSRFAHMFSCVCRWDS